MEDCGHWWTLGFGTEVLTGSPRRHFRPRSTPWRSGRVNRCRGRGFLSWRKEPTCKRDLIQVSWGALVHFALPQRAILFKNKDIFVYICINILRRSGQLTETAPLWPLSLYSCLHVSGSQIMIALFMSPLAWKRLSGHSNLTMESAHQVSVPKLICFCRVSCLSVHGRKTHQVLSIWGDGHAQDLRGVAPMTSLSSLPSPLYCVQLLSSLNVPWL